MLIEAGLPCDDCGSSDALAQYDNGTHCFSCGKTYRDSKVESHNWSPVTKVTEIPFTTLHIEENGPVGSFLKARHFTQSLWNEYGLKQSLDGNYLVLPEFSSNPRYYEIRYLGGNPKEPKYRTIGTKKILYQGGSIYGSTVICEDILSCIRIQEVYMFPCIALRGTSLSEETISQLCTHKIKNYITWFDSDEPGQKAAKAFKEKLQWTGASFSNIVTQKDPKWHTASEIKAIFRGELT